MYILGISGSPRIGGNTDILLEKALEGARSKGAKVEKIILNELKMVPCQECDDTLQDGSCKINDDFQKVSEKVKKADGVILASPIFFGSLSAQTKMMVDRYQCAWRYRKQASEKKPGALILVEASTRDDFLANAKSIAKNFFASAQIAYKDELLCKGIDEKGAILKHADKLDAAQSLGEKMIIACK